MDGSLPPDDRQFWAAPPLEFDRRVGLKELFEAQTDRTPSAVALEHGDERLTYAELDGRANALAELLVKQGVGPDSVVPVLAARGVQLTTAMLAVFKAGGAYLPLDPKHPPERLRQIFDQLEDGLALVGAAQRPLAEAALSDSPRRFELVNVGAVGSSPRRQPSRTSPRSLAYVIFTSGSTGAPKGAMVEQLGMVNHLFAKVSELSLGPADAIAQNASQCFDISVWQSFAAWVVGGRTVIIPDPVAADPRALSTEVAARRITILEVVPSLLSALVDDPRAEFQSLRFMVATGEALPPELCRRWFARHAAIPLVNAYGPTECSDDVTHHVLQAPPSATVTPIGAAIGNVALYVLDERLAPTPTGQRGELYVGGGVCVGRGYYRRPDLTAERYVPNPYVAGERLYRTGDLVARRADGTLEYYGRLDFQVKVRGYRIELEEIEARLFHRDEVREAVVLAREDSPGDQRLVAYVSPKEGRTIDSERLRTVLSRELPEYMVPAAIVVLPRLPLSSNGKVDRKALPVPTAAKAAEQDEAPWSRTERRVAQLWGKIRRLTKVGRNDNFFDVGGNSISMTQLAVLLTDLYEIDLPTGVIFKSPTVAGVAAAVDRALEKRSTADSSTGTAFRVTASGATGARDVPLSYTEERHLRFWRAAPPWMGGRGRFEAYWLNGVLDVPALRRAILAVMARHEVLRSTWTAAPDSFVRHVHVELPPPLDVADLSTEADPEAAAMEAVGAELGRVFDLTREPAFRIVVRPVSAVRHLFVIAVDHIAQDEEGFRLLLSDLVSFYGAFVQKVGEMPAPAAIQYADFAAWQRRLFAADGPQASEREFWAQHLRGATPLTYKLRTDHPREPVDEARARNAVTGFPSGVVPWTGSPGLAPRLTEISRGVNATLFTATFCALAIALKRFGEFSEGTLSVINDYRQRVGGLEGTVGAFNNSALVRFNLEGSPSYLEVLRRAQAELNQLYSRPEFPFIPVLFPAVNDLFRVAFNWLPTGAAAPTGFQGLPWERLSLRPWMSKFQTMWDLMFSATDIDPLGEGALRGTLSWNGALWNKETAQRMLDAYRDVLERMAQDPDGPAV